MDIKNQYLDALLLFRLGDFYELFFQDAIIASKELGITLTARDCGLKERAPMCGVPYHSVDNYINKLIQNGYKVAICEQIEDASEAKGIVKRDVVRVITPGTLIDTDLLSEKENNYLMSIYEKDKCIGLSYVDISTGELFSTEIAQTRVTEDLYDEICKVRPKEIIYYVEEDLFKNILDSCKKNLNIHLNSYENWRFDYQYAIKQFDKHFNVISIEGLGFSPNHLGIQSTGALIDYLQSTQKRTLNHLKRIQIYSLKDTMLLDLNTRRNLELTETIREKNKKGSLLWILDKTMTSMGGRMLRRWIEEPLLNVKKINERLDAVKILKENLLLRKELQECLKNVYDLERLSGKIAYGTVNPRDLIALKSSLNKLPRIKNIIAMEKTIFLKNILNNINCHEEVRQLVENAISDDPPVNIREGNIIKDGYDQDVDELRLISRDGKQWISTLETSERIKTGIKSLKIGYNRIFGYYIEVTKVNLHMVPEDYIRKQTLSNCERYITPELKEMESKVLGSEEKVMTLEYELFLNIRKKIEKEVPKIQETARAIAKLDAIFSLAQSADENGYNKPVVNNGTKINIYSGRHPVVEKMLDNNAFIENDTLIDGEQHKISIITGPNMAGKSTYMRQVALIVLMAQIGSFIPAKEATIGLVDRIFTRVGASDDLSQGQSTFMVEMSEMANILNNATKKSLLILDEIGRGTSTFDGLSIAWAVIEYISKKIKSKTLFSTHYHELTKLEGTINDVKNYCVAVKEEGEHIVFLRKVIDGRTDKSYGIQVAKLAGLPNEIIDRSMRILTNLEEKDTIKSKSINDDSNQLNFLNVYDNEIIMEIKNLHLMNTTPIEALNFLFNLQKMINDSRGD